MFYDAMPLNLFPLLCNGFLAYLPTYLSGFDTQFTLLLLKDISDWLHREVSGFVVTINL
jgi:hypothetical protein